MPSFDLPVFSALLFLLLSDWDQGNPRCALSVSQCIPSCWQFSCYFQEAPLRGCLWAGWIISPWVGKCECGFQGEKSEGFHLLTWGSKSIRLIFPYPQNGDSSLFLSPGRLRWSLGGTFRVTCDRYGNISIIIIKPQLTRFTCFFKFLIEEKEEPSVKSLCIGFCLFLSLKWQLSQCDLVSDRLPVCPVSYSAFMTNV